jgi:hypothetical protein
MAALHSLLKTCGSHLLSGWSSTRQPVNKPFPRGLCAFLPSPFSALALGYSALLFRRYELLSPVSCHSTHGNVISLSLLGCHSPGYLPFTSLQQLRKNFSKLPAGGGLLWAPLACWGLCLSTYHLCVSSLQGCQLR